MALVVSENRYKEVLEAYNKGNLNLDRYLVKFRHMSGDTRTIHSEQLVAAYAAASPMDDELFIRNLNIILEVGYVLSD